DFRQRTAAIAYIDSLAVRIVAEIVGVIAVIKGFQRGIRTPIKYSNASILGICDVQPIDSRHVQDALGFLESADRLYPLAGLRIDNFYRVIAESGNEQTPAFYVRGQVVNPALHVRQLDGFFQPQGLTRLSPC